MCACVLVMTQNTYDPGPQAETDPAKMTDEGIAAYISDLEFEPKRRRRPRGIPIENEIQSLNMSVASLARVAWFLLRREKPKPDPT